MKTKEFDYHLPPELIAQQPLPRRDSSRLLVLNRKDDTMKEVSFDCITDFIDSRDCLVLNDTKVIPARVFGKKRSGAKIEFLFVNKTSDGVWEVLVKPAKRIREGSLVIFGQNDFEAKVLEKTSKGTWLVSFSLGNVKELMTSYGIMPTPPYIKEELKNEDCYQTIYAKKKGAIAAPTAGLHFTSSILNKFSKNKVRIAYITLHVGLGTFRPIKAEDINEHIMEKESYNISEEAASIINETKASGGRVFAAGTTVVRALESAARINNGAFIVEDGHKEADIFIKPGYKFKIVDALLTNFHLPDSTNLVLVSSFAGISFIKKAYSYAIERRFRFYSFGDAMLIL